MSKPTKDHIDEHHVSHKLGWLRAAVLGANDGIISTASVMMGVAAASVSHQALLLTGTAALVAGALSMAAGEYVSVSTQADSEAVDLAIEKAAIEADPVGELQELAHIYRQRGLSDDLAQQVATQLMAIDPLGAHMRDELGLTDTHKARPIQAAWTSALSFAIGAALPLLAAIISPPTVVAWSLGLSSLVALIGLGIVSAQVGGANKLKAAIRVSFWGLAAMGLTYAVGTLFGVVT
ncbi:membrane protein [Algimonas arctica]|uniref:Membrane protein n=1 Tax=Algimonas arctica TaxID=1479486 RepID=A0A8J3CRI1_9PROT|nr:VIT family protein [Algimonas arctica]GHA88644.1 membrane protein [Algimonas arctica]